MPWRIRYHDNAQSDLLNLQTWIEDKAGPSRADDYIDSILDYCDGFTTFPLRGTRRDDLYPGLRTVGFKRKITIAFTVNDDDILIWRILSAGRNIEDVIEDSDPP
ncbi:MAG: type II toxin-antitoxin system RelE/ParE family toxin [Rhodospirillaceae bacterium]|nr:type II toxin-antitoxin system RelE/ParE family toxin [Rhodospirillaceae bacterium]